VAKGSSYAGEGSIHSAYSGKESEGKKRTPKVTDDRRGVFQALTGEGAKDHLAKVAYDATQDCIKREEAWEGPGDKGKNRVCRPWKWGVVTLL